jgi:hypothetical protein
MLRVPGGLPDGEYRSHLWIRQEADPEKFRQSIEPADPNATSISIQMLTGVTIPVIVRKGNLRAEAGIDNLAATETGGYVNIAYNLTRTGTKSIYGNMDFVCNEGAVNEFLLSSLRGVGVYEEINYRTRQHRYMKKDLSQSCDTMTVNFYDALQSDDPKTNLSATSTIAVQKL